ncbi:MAG: endonuclease [Chloroflexota bacterium]|nr:endonuclease [Lentimicrobium sp.]
MKRYYTLFLLLTVVFLQAQPPAGYYNSASGLTGTQLQAALHDIIDNHIVQSYSSLPELFQQTDRKPNGTVWDMYSDVPGGNPPYVYNFVSTDQCGNYNSEGDCFNREHSWPKSWFDDQSPMYSDMFHLYPTDGYVNGKRSNYPYGEVGNATWTSLNGCKLGSCIFPGYSGTVFEPIDDYKGDFARTYFYMSTRYYQEDSGWPGSDQTTGSQLKPWALAMMKEWNVADPVSQKEIDRNNAVYNIQHNRNPFIDHPEYVSYIWGGPTGISEHEIYTNLRVYPVPATENCIIDYKGYYDANALNVSITDMTGRQYTVTYSVSGSEIKINSQELSRGFYLVTLMQEGKNPAFARFVK